MTRSTRHRTARARRRLADRVRTRPRLEGLEDRCMLSPAIAEFNFAPSPAGTQGITTGPDGNLWFANMTGSIGEINPTTHAVTEFTVPTGNPYSITAGPDGNLWFAAYSHIGEINPTTHAITEFTVPTGLADGITAGPDGNLWFTAEGQLGEINPTTDAIAEFALPAGSDTIAITVGPDGNLWFTDTGSNSIGMINPTTHAISEFAIPTAGAEPQGITTGPDGNLWFTEYREAGQIGMINPTTHAISEFELPGDTEPSGITAGPDGNLWFTVPYFIQSGEYSIGQIGSINPTSHAVADFPVPYAKSHPTGITVGPDGNLWFADNGAGSIGLATLSTTSLVVTQQPPSSVAAGSPFGLTVEAENSSGNPVTSFNGTVTVTMPSYQNGATLGGTLTASASGGVATFSGLTITTAGSGYTIVATSSGVGEGVTNAMTVTPAAATQLVITQQPPSTVNVSSPFSMQASIEDAYGNVVTTDSGRVSVAFANNPAGATLGGTLTVTASQGVASFSNLTINKTGSGYTLRVSSSGLTSATSSSINVTKTGQTASALLAPAGNPATDLSLAPLVLDSPDLWDGLGFKKRPRSI